LDKPGVRSNFTTNLLGYYRSIRNEHRKGEQDMSETQRQMTWDEVVAQLVVYRNERDALSVQIDALRADATRYRWLRYRIKVSKQQAVSGSVRDALEVKVGCSFIDSRAAQGSPAAYSIEQSEKLDAAIDAAIAKESKT
jgi:hypothetical protein